MKILFYSSKNFEKPFLNAAKPDNYQMDYVTEPLSINSAPLSKEYECISVFTADDVSAPVIRHLAGYGVKMIAVRAAGFDNIDLEAANENNIVVANVPEYSPYAVAEHAVALMLALNRKIVTANEKVNAQNFILDDLIGFDLHKKIIGIIGTGKIGSILAKIMHGFGCTILAYDVVKNQTLISRYDAHYVELHTLCSRSDIISIHTPLNSQTRYLITESQIQKMKKGVMIINTARGGIVNIQDIITYLENGHIGYYGMDVYEKEKGIFFYDQSGKNLNDPVFSKLLSLKNVLITPHQAFATREALSNIATTTFLNIDSWLKGARSGNELTRLKEEKLFITG